MTTSDERVIRKMISLSHSLLERRRREEEEVVIECRIDVRDSFVPTPKNVNMNAWIVINELPLTHELRLQN